MMKNLIVTLWCNKCKQSSVDERAEDGDGVCAAKNGNDNNGVDFGFGVIQVKVFLFN